MSSSVCSEQHHHKFHPSHQEVLISSPAPTKQKIHLHNIEIPPRKLLSRKIHNRQMSENHNESFLDSPKHSSSSPEEASFRKSLPHNTGYDDDDDYDPYSSDHFMMFEFKVRRCTRSRSHDWTDCPFAHTGEKARRRYPRKYCYSGTVCPDFRRGRCSRGESCEFAHWVFECWLHPNRYRTEACKDGKNCKRKVCFFAHTPRQLRLPPVSTSPELMFKKSSSTNNCCVYCHHSITYSPTSTLMMGMSHSHHHLSPPLSPPISPVKRHSLNAFSFVSRFNDQFNSGVLGYEEALEELRSSFEVMNFFDGFSPTSGGNNNGLSWIDDSFSGDDLNQQFILSPSSSSAPTKHSFGGGACSSEGLVATSNSNANYSASVYQHDKLNETNGWGTLDLGWVNELLM